MSINTEKGTALEPVPTANVAPTSARQVTRKRFSALERLAFWAFQIGAVGGVGGVITITITSGSPSWDIIVIAATAMACTLILATKLRWAPAVASLLGAFNLYLTLTEPFVIESLANPKGPNGGLGHFIMDVLVVACTIIALGASVAATVQNYRNYHDSSRSAPRWLPAALSVVAGMVVGAVFIGVLAQPAAFSQTTYTNGVATVHLGAGNFLQSSVTISKGSKLLLVDNTTSMHDLYNGSWENGSPAIAPESGAPVINNVRLQGTSVAIGPFTAAGTYHLLCLKHRGMNLTIIVR